jgi:ubiquitin carboxyl-terminal hydrolase 14
VRRLLYIAIFGGLGLYTGKNVMTTVVAPAAPDTPDDSRQMKQIQETLNLLPIVRQLRADPDYVEWEAYDRFSEEDKKHRLTSGPLKGSRGLAVQVGFSSIIVDIAIRYPRLPSHEFQD